MNNMRILMIQNLEEIAVKMIWMINMKEEDLNQIKQIEREMIWQMIVMMKRMKIIEDNNHIEILKM